MRSTLLRRYAEFLTHHALAVLLSVAALTAVIASGIAHLHTEFDMEKSLPADHPYVAIDREIGMLIADAGPDARIMVVAPHGMGALAHASWHLSEILDLLGYGRADGTATSANRRGRINPWRIAKMVVPSRWQYAIKDALPQTLQDQLLFLWYAGGRRYRGRQAFAVPNNRSALVSFSVKSAASAPSANR